MEKRNKIEEEMYFKIFIKAQLFKIVKNSFINFQEYN